MLGAGRLMLDGVSARSAPYRSTAFLLAAALIAAGLFVGCTIDTELGVAATVGSAKVFVQGQGGTSTVRLEGAVDFRVGEHAQESHLFVVPTVDVFVDRAPAAMLRPNPEIQRMLAPGEMVSVAVLGETAPGAFAGAVDLLCAPGATAEILLRWEDRTTMMFEMVSAPVASIDCTP